eukprot:1743334-Prymnesium_polylepis.1
MFAYWEENFGYLSQAGIPLIVSEMGGNMACCNIIDDSPSGLRWVDAGKVRPEGGKDLNNQMLAEALRFKPEFTPLEWEAFEIDDLKQEHT